MSPCLAQLNTADEVLRDPKASGQFWSCHLASSGPDCQHVSLGKFGPRTLATPAKAGRRRGCKAYAMRMTDVFNRLSPFQVSEAIVGLDAIDVVALFAWPRWSGESCKNQAVHPEMYCPIISAQVNTEVAGRRQARFENAASMCTVVRRIPSHVAEIGDLVETFVIGNGQPGFLDQGKLCRLREHRKGYSFRCHVAGRHPPSRPHLLYHKMH